MSKESQPVWGGFPAKPKPGTAWSRCKASPAHSEQECGQRRARPACEVREQVADQVAGCEQGAAEAGGARAEGRQQMPALGSLPVDLLPAP